MEQEEGISYKCEKDEIFRSPCNTRKNSNSRLIILIYRSKLSDPDVQTEFGSLLRDSPDQIIYAITVYISLK